MRDNLSDTLRSKIGSLVISRITAGIWKPGDRIPSESQLMQLFGASRMTVHHAMRELTSRGFLTRRNGAGTFVPLPKPYVAEYRHEDVMKEIVGRGGVHHAQVFIREMVAASPGQAASLGCPAGMMLFHALILHCENGRPLELEDRLINPVELADCMAVDLSKETLFSRLMLMRPYRNGSETMRAIMPTAEEQGMLEIDGQTPCLEIFRRTSTDHGAVTSVRLLRAGEHAIAKAIVRPVSQNDL